MTTTTKPTKGVVTEAEARRLSPVYVAHVKGKWSSKIWEGMERLKRGQKVLTCWDSCAKKPVFVVGRVSQVNHNDIRAIDGPVVRVTNDEYSWRVDGNGDCAAIR